jgi:hypothetical protein
MQDSVYVVYSGLGYEYNTHIIAIFKSKEYAEKYLKEYRLKDRHTIYNLKEYYLNDSYYDNQKQGFNYYCIGMDIEGRVFHKEKIIPESDIEDDGIKLRDLCDIGICFYYNCYAKNIKEAIEIADRIRLENMKELKELQRSHNE